MIENRGQDKIKSKFKFTLMLGDEFENPLEGNREFTFTEIQ